MKSKLIKKNYNHAYGYRHYDKKEIFKVKSLE